MDTSSDLNTHNSTKTSLYLGSAPQSCTCLKHAHNSSNFIHLLLEIIGKYARNHVSYLGIKEMTHQSSLQLESWCHIYPFFPRARGGLWTYVVKGFHFPACTSSLSMQVKTTVCFLPKSCFNMSNAELECPGIREEGAFESLGRQKVLNLMFSNPTFKM